MCWSNCLFLFLSVGLHWLWKQMDQPLFAVDRKWSKETVAGMAWGCPTTHREIRRHALILCSQHMPLLQEGTGELSYFLCSLLRKTVGCHGANTFQEGTDTWENSPLCTGQITPFLQVVTATANPESFIGCSWAFPWEWQDRHSSRITTALWMLWGPPAAPLC